MQTCSLRGWDEGGLCLCTWGSGRWRWEIGGGRTRTAVLEGHSRGERRRREGRAGGERWRRRRSQLACCKWRRRPGEDRRRRLRWGRVHELRGVEGSRCRGWRWRWKRRSCRRGVLEWLINSWSPSSRCELLDLGVSWSLEGQKREQANAVSHILKGNQSHHTRSAASIQYKHAKMFTCNGTLE